jgi:hypothetical protein
VNPPGFNGQPRKNSFFEVGMKEFFELLMVRRIALEYAYEI